jgi:hypothetical protein
MAGNPAGNGGKTQNPATFKHEKRRESGNMRRRRVRVLIANPPPNPHALRMKLQVVKQTF